MELSGETGSGMFIDTRSLKIGIGRVSAGISLGLMVAYVLLGILLKQKRLKQTRNTTNTGF
jgi:hypothetical protein